MTHEAQVTARCVLANPIDVALSARAKLSKQLMQNQTASSVWQGKSAKKARKTSGHGFAKQSARMSQAFYDESTNFETSLNRAIVGVITPTCREAGAAHIVVAPIGRLDHATTVEENTHLVESVRRGLQMMGPRTGVIGCRSRVRGEFGTRSDALTTLGARHCGSCGKGTETSTLDADLFLGLRRQN